LHFEIFLYFYFFKHIRINLAIKKAKVFHQNNKKFQVKTKVPFKDIKIIDIFVTRG
jgi:hypothetical protein